DIGTVDELIKRFRHIESVRRKLITRTRFQKKPNVSAISAETNLVDIRSVIRKIGVELENISLKYNATKMKNMSHCLTLDVCYVKGYRGYGTPFCLKMKPYCSSTHHRFSTLSHSYVATQT
ncbi:hypothetical protein TNCT_300521, partial [Trichonephila clavata]